ncbi:unnamed protein product [Protopolystoma xenopodis]|uniref:Uncharacterized protein n=1 Tax=Protopolystoma xenopodis TaxID=117903 RepID=A0A3S5CG21_9PLAT|nr:unnamed protein product [Protopolystoma xenopodis]
MTLELSSTGDVANSDEVAKVLMADIAAGRRISSFGLQGASLAWLVAGIEPPICSDWLPGATIGTILECLAASPLRLIGIYQAYRMRRIVAKHQRDTTVTYGHRLNTCS